MDADFQHQQDARCLVGTYAIDAGAYDADTRVQG